MRYYHNEPYTPVPVLFNLLSFDLNSPFCSSRRFVIERIPYHINSGHQILTHVFSHPDLDNQEQPVIQEQIFFCGQWHRELNYSHFAEILTKFLGLNENPILWISPQIGHDPRNTRSNSAFYFSIRTDTGVTAESILSLSKLIQFNYGFNYGNRTRKLIHVNYFTEPMLFDRDEVGLPRGTLAFESPRTYRGNFPTYRDLRNLICEQQCVIQNKFGFFSQPKKRASEPAPLPIDAGSSVLHR